MNASNLRPIVISSAAALALAACSAGGVLPSPGSAAAGAVGSAPSFSAASHAKQSVLQYVMTIRNDSGENVQIRSMRTSCLMNGLKEANLPQGATLTKTVTAYVTQSCPVSAMNLRFTGARPVAAGFADGQWVKPVHGDWSFTRTGGTAVGISVPDSQRPLAVVLKPGRV